MRWIVFSFLLLFMTKLMAIESVRLKEVGPTGKTLVINYGSNDGLLEGDKAYFLTRLKETSYKAQKVALGEAVKVFEGHSYWYLKSIILPEKIQKGSTLLFATQKEVLRGRKNYNFQNKEILYSKDAGTTAEQTLKQYRGEEPPTGVLQAADEHRISEQVDIHSPHRMQENDIELLGLARLEQDKILNDSNNEEVASYKAQELRKSPSLKKMNKKLRHQEFEERLNYYLSRAEDPDLDLEKLYYDQRKDQSDGLVKVSPSLLSTYEKAQRNKQIQKVTRSRAIEEIQAKGPGWSAELSDQALRRYMVRKGLDFERLRQSYNAENTLNHEIFGSFQTDLIDHTTESDNENRGIGYGLNIGYELPLKKISLALNRFTLRLGYRHHKSSLGIADQNVFQKDSSFLVGFQWFPYFAPSTLARFLPYLGLGMRLGKTELVRNTFLQSYTFSSRSLPALILGVKYRFALGTDNAFGLKSELSLEKTRLDLADSNVATEIPSIIEFSHMKFAMGLSYYF